MIYNIPLFFPQVKNPCYHMNQSYNKNVSRQQPDPSLFDLSVIVSCI